jgi:hypothetical protein
VFYLGVVVRAREVELQKLSFLTAISCEIYPADLDGQKREISKDNQDKQPSAYLQRVEHLNWLGEHQLQVDPPRPNQIKRPLICLVSLRRRKQSRLHLGVLHTKPAEAPENLL